VIRITAALHGRRYAGAAKPLWDWGIPVYDSAERKLRQPIGDPRTPQKVGHEWATRTGKPKIFAWWIS